ncbi:hypothetical protein BH09ACT9_BH09ACT9_00780 [soil metagenome]
MSNTTRALIAGTVLVLALTGCTAQTTNVATPTSTTQAVAVPTSTPDITASATAEADFLAKVKRQIGDLGMSDAELVALGHHACDLMNQGVSRDTVEVLPVPTADATASKNNSIIVRVAQLQFCQQWQ